MKKQAYLIIAHNEFIVLQKLINALDDKRNDIYIHIDKKVQDLPVLTALHARLFILEERIGVYWGDTTQLDAEYVLMESALKNGGYDYYHIISGVHLPLKSQDEIHDFFKDSEYSYLMKQETSEKEITLKIRRYNFFVKHKYKKIARMDVFFWHLLIRIQRIFGISRNKNKAYEKASQWVSLNNDAVEYMVRQKKSVIKSYKYTYCTDEFFVASELSRSENVKIMDCPTLLKCDFDGVSPKIFKMSDYEELMESGCLFARKFSEKYIDVVDRILAKIKSQG